MLVAALVAAAGCNALAPTETTSEPTTTSPPAPPPSLYDPPLNDTAVLAAHVDALRAAGSYTLTSNTTVVASGRVERTVRTVVRGDLATGRVLVDSRSGDRVRQLYRYGNGTTYERSVAGGSSSYGAAAQQARNASAWSTAQVARALALFHFEYAGTTDGESGTVHVYRASGSGALDRTETFFDESASATVTGAQASLHVRPDGTVVRVSYRYSTVIAGGATTVSFSGAFAELGDTDASPPVWVDTARNRTA